MHYCMDKFAGFSFSSSKKEKCAKCGMTNTGCCKDEKKQIKLSSDQQKSECNQNNNLIVPTILKSFLIYNNTYSIVFKNKQTIAYLHLPPLILCKNKQALFSNFLI